MKSAKKLIRNEELPEQDGRADVADDESESFLELSSLARGVGVFPSPLSRRLVC
jgi:hypothetical protein